MTIVPRSPLEVLLATLLLTGSPGSAIAEVPNPAEELPASIAALGDRSPAADQSLTKQNSEHARALALYYQGNQLIADGKIEKAVKTFREVIAVDPSNIDLASRTAALLAQLGEISQARELVEEAMAANPNKIEGSVMVANFLRTFAPDDKAAQEFALEVARAAVKQFPKEPRAYKILTRYHLERGEAQEASAALETALSQEDVPPNFWVLIGMLGHSVWPYRGDRGSKENLHKLVEIYYRALEQGSDTPRDVQHSVARFFRATGELDNARGLYQGMVQALPEDLETRALYAHTLLAMGRAEDGIAELEKLAEIDPNDRQTHETLANAYKNMEAYPDAARHMSAAIRLGANSISHYRTGMVYYSQANDLEGLIAHLERAKITFPNEPYFHRILADVYSNNSDWENALLEYEQTEAIALKHPEPERLALEFNPPKLQNLSFLHHHFYFEYGAAAERLKQFERAAALFQKSIDLVPEENPALAAPAYNYLGYMWLEQEINIEEAGNLIRLAVDLAPESGAYADSLGWYYFLTGDFQNAITELQRADTLMRTDYSDAFQEALDLGRVTEKERSTSGGADPTVLEHLARTHAALGNTQQAISKMEEAVAIEGSTPEMKERLERYKKHQFE